MYYFYNQENIILEGYLHIISYLIFVQIRCITHSAHK